MTESALIYGSIDHESKNVFDFLCLYCCCMHIHNFYILLLLKQLSQVFLVSSSGTKNQLFSPNIWHKSCR